MSVSVYGTVYNNGYVIRDSLDSLIASLKGLRDNYELVVVDNFSNDGTWEILLEYASRYGNIRPIQRKCSRGLGRHLALEVTRGDYVMWIDFDQIFRRSFGGVVERLRRICSDNEMWNLGCVLGFCRRETMTKKVGGWSDLNFAEDREMLKRAVCRGVLIKRILMLEPWVNVRHSGPKRGEKRYSSNSISFVSRRIRNITDLVRVEEWSPAEAALVERFPRPRALVVAMLSSILALKRLPSRRWEKSASEIVFTSEQYIMPEELGFPRSLLFSSWQCLRAYGRIFYPRIRDTAWRAGPDTHVTYLEREESVAMFRSREVIEEFLRRQRHIWSQM